MNSTTIYDLGDKYCRLKADNVCYIERIIMIPFPISPIDGMDRWAFDHFYSMDSMSCINMMGKDDNGDLKIFKDISDDSIRDILIDHANEFYRYTQAEQVKHHNRAHLPYIRIREWWINLKHVNDHMIYKSDDHEDDNIDYLALCFGDPSEWNGVLSLNCVNPTLINNDEDSWQDMNPVNAAKEIVEILSMRRIKRNANELPSCFKEYRNKNGEVTAFYAESNIKDTSESES
jgi:hypothetical protein